MKLWRDWDGFWFTPQTTRLLSVYRMALGVVVLVSLAWRAPWVELFYADNGLFTFATICEMRGFTPPSLMALSSGPVMVWLCFAASVVAAFCFTLGLATRASSIALFGLAASFQVRNPLVHNSGDAAVVAMLFLFMFAPADQVYSFDSWWRRRKGTALAAPVLHAPWVQRAMQCQIALLWLMAGYHKAHGTLWYTGTAMYYIFGQIGFAAHGVEALMNYPLVYTSLTLATVFTELAIPFLLWFRRARPYAVAMIFAIQMSIALFLTLTVFPLFTLSSTLLFLDEDELPAGFAVWRKLRRGAVARTPLVGDSIRAV